MERIPPWAAYFVAVATIVIGIISYTHQKFTTYREFHAFKERMTQDNTEVKKSLDRLNDKMDRLIERLSKK